LSSPDIDDRGKRRKVFVLIDPRYRPRHLAVKAVGDLANALHIPGESLSAQRAGDGKQIFLWPGSFKHGLERIPERLAFGTAAGVARLAFLERTPDASLTFLEASANPSSLCYAAVLSGLRH
jgi:hypothetical protein